MVMIRCREHLDKGVESFEKIVAEVKAIAKDQEKELQLLTERVLIDLIQSRLGTRKSKETTAQKSIRKINLTQAEKKKKIIKFTLKERSKEPYDEKNNKAAAAVSSARNNQLIMKRKRNLEDEEYDQYIEDNACKLMRKKKMMKKMKAKRKKIQPNLPRPPIPTEFMNKIKSLNGSEVKLVIQKKLTITDLSIHHERLTIPQNQVINKDFLDKPYEKEFKHRIDIPVGVIKPSLQVSELRLRRWNMTSTYTYALISGWKSIFMNEKEKLKVGDHIQVWSFWVNNEDHLSETQLWFALVNLGPLGEEDANGTTQEGANGTTGSTQEDTNGTTQEGTNGTTRSTQEDANGSSGSNGTSMQTNESSVTQNRRVEQPASD